MALIWGLQYFVYWFRDPFDIKVDNNPFTLKSQLVCDVHPQAEIENFEHMLGKGLLTF